MLKAGDKVQCIKRGKSKGSVMNWTVRAGIKKGGTYEVQDTSQDNVVIKGFSLILPAFNFEKIREANNGQTL